MTFDLGPLTSHYLVHLLSPFLDERARASLVHMSRLHLIRTENFFPASTESELTSPAYLLMQAIPTEFSHRLVDLPTRIDDLRNASATAMMGLTGMRWHQDGVTFLNQIDIVRDAITFFHQGGVELFSRSPFYQTEATWHISLELLAQHLLKTLEAYEVTRELLALPSQTYIDLSLVGVKNLPLSRQNPFYFSTPPHFDRNHVHLVQDWEPAGGKLEDELAPLLNWLCQSGGLQGMPERKG